MKKIKPELSAESLAALSLRESMWDEEETRKNILRKTDDILDKFADFLEAGELFFDRAVCSFDRIDDVLALADALVATGAKK